MNKPKLKQTNAAFSLVECTVAVGVACLSLVPMIGLLPVGLSGAKSASSQTSAMNIATAIASDLRTATEASSPRYGIQLNSGTSSQTLYLDEGGAPQTAQNADSRYRAQVTLVPVTGTLDMARVTITWPAQAGSKNASGSVETVMPIGTGAN